MINVRGNPLFKKQTKSFGVSETLVAHHDLFFEEEKCKLSLSKRDWKRNYGGRATVEANEFFVNEIPRRHRSPPLSLFKIECYFVDLTIKLFGHFQGIEPRKTI